MTPGERFVPASGPAPGGVEVLSTTYNGQDAVIHLLTVNGSDVTYRTLTTALNAFVGDASRGVALLVLPAGLAAVDIYSGSAKTLLTTPRSCDVEWGVLSPDAGTAAVQIRNEDLTYQILIVDLRSGSTRKLVHLGRADYGGLGLYLWRWRPDGILVSPDVNDCKRSGLLRLDATSGSISRIADTPIDLLSPNGSLYAASDHVDMGDGPFEGQCWWENRLSIYRIGGTAALIASKPRRVFAPAGLSDDGSLLYTISGDGSFAAPASDMGFYLYRNGVSTRQTADENVWAVFAGPREALLSKSPPPGLGSEEIDLVSLCEIAGCVATTHTVYQAPAQTSLGSLVLVRQ